MKHIGFGLFSLGTIVAVTAGAKAPAKIGEWPDTLPVFIVGALVCIVGLVLWHRGTTAETKRAITEGEQKDPVALIDALQAPLNALGEEVGELDADRIMNRVDALLNGFVLPFAEVRRQVIDRFGMEQGAEILVVMAYGERILNRTWTAAADGHLPEARSCYAEAAEALRESHTLLSQAESA
jgi:hypothetical protein